jgi:hypothetical protein
MAAGDFIIPEVYADLAQASFTGKVKVLGSPAVMDDNTLVGQPGETITFPKWGALGELDDLTTGVAMVPTELEQTESSATIKEAGKAVVINDRDKLTALGNPQSEAVRQFGVLSSRKVDGDLITEARTAAGRLTVTTTAGTTTFGLAALNQGFALFGDECEPEEFAGIYIHSEQLNEAFSDDAFVAADKLGDNSLVRRGVVGLLRGVPVLVSNRLTAGEYLLMKQNVLGALTKRAPLVETDRDVLKRQDVVTTNIHYAVKAVTPSGIAHVTLAAA